MVYGGMYLLFFVYTIYFRGIESPVEPETLILDLLLIRYKCVHNISTCTDTQNKEDEKKNECVGQYLCIASWVEIGAGGN